MSKTELQALVDSYNEWTELLEQAKEQVETLKDELKSELNCLNVDELETDTYVIRWTPVTSNRFDSASFKKALPEVYKAYTKQSASKRFSVTKL
jgi:predicted phage-related endonuclease